MVLIRQMAEDNLLWSAERIRGELLKLNIEVSKRTIQKYMPKVRRPSGQTWVTSLKNHASDVWACDFTLVHDLLFRALYIFVITELGSRRIVHYAVTRNRPMPSWRSSCGKRPIRGGTRYLIRDNDAKYGASLGRVAAGTGMQVLRTPYGAPRANAICGRFFGSLRRECLDFFLLLGEVHLHWIVREYVTYFNHTPPHQGVQQRNPCHPELMPPSGRVVSHPVLGGLHYDNRRQAA